LVGAHAPGGGGREGRRTVGRPCPEALPPYRAPEPGDIARAVQAHRQGQKRGAGSLKLAAWTRVLNSTQLNSPSRTTDTPLHTVSTRESVTKLSYPYRGPRDVQYTYTNLLSHGACRRRKCMLRTSHVEAACVSTLNTPLAAACRNRGLRDNVILRSFSSTSASGVPRRATRGRSSWRRPRAR